ncbi:MAG TPA: 50S ribosomal protein L30 [Candidatus Thalassarchaeaceae archaeon]|jgi:large subunit ribosomal protein L30|nr:50S ribosomal protein L30 [Candidatus Thalassarchaeaceae archaeon]DAC49197.1 MAG TPA: 50S ribosomal protein L30 [Candidatus Poseidoniales archaeon]HIH83417.1 50S ribosomal protein L30 [Candidatus Thalassarchaeaceae archaeon]|tara:strand:+ start:36 stop:506 length:471 start_codon:yes stop_codon:yes gene_type:complete
MTWLVIRVRSNIGVERSIRETMGHLNLTRVNHAVLIPENEAYAGMLQKAKDYITWGKVDEETITSLISERGRLMGDKPITDKVVKAETDFKSIKAFATAIATGDSTTKAIADMKPVFRLHPPRGTKGWGGIKRHFTVGGALGYRGEAITDLAGRMI